MSALVCSHHETDEAEAEIVSFLVLVIAFL